MKNFIVSVDWYGPYSRHELFNAAFQAGIWSGMYLARGTSKDVGSIILQYIGISFSNYPYRIKENHPKLDIVSNPEMFGGILRYHNAPDLPRLRESAAYHHTLKYLETLLVYLLQPPLNDTDVFKLPSEEAIIINRWFDGSDPNAMLRRASGEKAVPDFIEYDPIKGARFAWTGEQPRTEVRTRDGLQASARRKTISN